MIIGVGIDVCSVARMQAALDRWGEKLWRRILGEAERERLAERIDRATALAGRFAAKEAALKALGGGRGVSWHELEIVGEPFRPPALRLHGVAARLAAELGVAHSHLSITHDAGVAAAVVIVEARSASP
jgi:holo-[acyl-carrier protein] synthase